jgi:hypothetical protein
MAQDIEFGGRDPERLLLQGIRPLVDDEEPDEVARRADRELTELQRIWRPRLEGPIPRQIQQRSGAVSEPEPRERRG